ncbi:MAG TPA: hypothetical protein VMD59_01495 [Acidimicrobiales bacterium]|nr:hypothetical protein [Acidimicrobiales bacterium]
MSPAGSARGAAEQGEGAALERPPAELGYAEAAAELEGIIAELDGGLVDVDHLEVRFGRAIDLVEELDRRIHRARGQVDALLPRLGAIGSQTAGSTSPAGAGTGTGAESGPPEEHGSGEAPMS